MNQSDSKKPHSNKPIQGTSVNTAILIRFGLILVFICTFIGLVWMAISSVREVKEFVADENLRKAGYYQAAINDVSLQQSLSANIATCDANILEFEDELDDTINLVLALCAVNIACIIAATMSTMNYVKAQVVQPIIHFKEESKKLAVGIFDLDFTCDSRAIEIQELSRGLSEAASEFERFVRVFGLGLDQMTNKNFAQLPKGNFPGELKELEEAMQKLGVIVSGTLRDIVDSAEEVTVSANAMSVGSQSLAQGATEQRNSVDSLSLTIAEIAKMVADTATNASDANALGAKAGAVLDSSAKEMDELMDAIAQIERSSSDIEQIIKTIDDIAFQTNILALNAAIEAARAGRFGKSFAVVADEVRSLAQKSAMAAHDTTALIDSSLEAIRRGAALANSTNKAFADVKENSTQVLDVVQHIADSSKLQSTSIDDIHASVQAISNVITNNSATSEESANASIELSTQADKMNDMLSEFRLHGVRYR